MAIHHRKRTVLCASIIPYSCLYKTIKKKHISVVPVMCQMLQQGAHAGKGRKLHSLCKELHQVSKICLLQVSEAWMHHVSVYFYIKA